MAAYTTVVTHATGDVFPATDWNTYIRDNFAFLHDQGADLASAATLVGITNQFHRITGTTTITAITAPAGTGQGGNRLLLKFISAGCTITAGAALVLTNGAFVSVAGGMIEFVWDATLAGWVEIGRVNGLPALELANVDLTAFTNITVTTEATAAAFATLPSVTLDGATTVVLDAHWYATKGTAFISFALYDNGVDQGFIQSAPSAVMLAGTFPYRWSRRLTPTAAAHVYTVRAWVDAGTGTAGGGAGGAGVALPGFFRMVRA